MTQKTHMGVQLPIQQRKKEKKSSYKSFFQFCCCCCLIKTSYVLPTSKLIHFLHFGAFHLISQERFGQLVAGPAAVTTTRGHLRAGINQQCCRDSCRAALPPGCLKFSQCFQGSCFLFMVTLINRDSTGIASNALN